MSILHSSLALISLQITGLILIGLDNRYTAGAIKFVLDNVLVKTKSRLLAAYFYTWTIFLVYNLYTSLLGMTNFIILDENIAYSSLFITGHFFIMIIGAIYETGLKNVLGTLASFRAIRKMTGVQGIMLFTNLLTNFIIKPISLLLRLVINVYMGNIIHEVFEHYKYGYIVLEIMTLLKFAMYFIQVYIIILLTNKVYQHLTESDHH